MFSFRKSLAGRSNNDVGGEMAANSTTATAIRTTPSFMPTTPSSITTATTTAMTTTTANAELENVEAISPLSSSSSSPESVTGKSKERSPGRANNKTSSKSSGVKVPFYRLKSFKKRNNAIIAPPPPTTTVAATRTLVSSGPSSTSLLLVHRNHNNILISNMVRRSSKWSGRCSKSNNNNTSNSSRGVMKKVVQLKQTTSATATQQQLQLQMHVTDDENSQAKDNAIANTSIITKPLHSTKLQTQYPIQQSSLSTETSTTPTKLVIVHNSYPPINNNNNIGNNDDDDDYEIVHLENECARLTQQITQLLLYRADRKYTQQYYDLELKLSIAQDELAAAREDRNLHFSHHPPPNLNGGGSGGGGGCNGHAESRNTIIHPISMNNNYNTQEEEDQKTNNNVEMKKQSNNNCDGLKNINVINEGGLKKKLLLHKYQQLDDELMTHPKFSLSWFRVKEKLHDLGIILNDYQDEDDNEDEEEVDTPREINICVSTHGDLMTNTECTSPLTSPYSPSVSLSLVENEVYKTTTTTTQSPHRRGRHRNYQHGIFTLSKSPPASPIHLMRSLSPPLPSLNAASSSSSCNTDDLKSQSTHSSPPCSISSGWSGGGGGGGTHRRSSSSQSPYHKYESRNIYCMTLDDNDDDDLKVGKKGTTDMYIFKDARIQAINILKAEETTSTEQLTRFPVFSKDWFDVKTRLVGLYDQITRLEKSDDFDISSNNSTNTSNNGGGVLDSSCDSGSHSTTTGTRNDQSYISGWSSTNDASSCAWSESEDEILSHVDELDLSMVTEALKYREEDDANSAEEDDAREDTELLLNPSSVVGISLERQGSNDSIINDSMMLATQKVNSILDDFSSILFYNHTAQDGDNEKRNFYALMIQEQWRRYIRQGGMTLKKEIHAATTIQSHFRKVIHRSNYKQQVTLAIVIQTWLRKYWLTTGKLYTDRREVVFHSSTLGLQLQRGRDGFARILSVTESESATFSPTSVVRDGKIIPGDLIVNACGIKVCRPMTVNQWVDIIRRIKSTPRPISFVVVSIPSKEIVQATMVIQSHWRKVIDQRIKMKEDVDAATIIQSCWRKAIDQQISPLCLPSSTPIPGDKDANVADNPRILSLNSPNTSLSHKLSIVEKIPFRWGASLPIPKNMVDDETDPYLSDKMQILTELEFPADQICVTQNETSPRNMNVLSECNDDSKRLHLMQQDFHTQAEIILASSNKKMTKSQVERELEYHHEDMECSPHSDESHHNSTSTSQQQNVTLLGRTDEQSKLSFSKETDDGELIKPQLTSCLNTFPPQTVSSPKEICEKTTSVGKLRQLWEGKKSSPSSSLDLSAPSIRYEMNSPANHKQQKTRLLKANVERKLAPELKLVSSLGLNLC